MLGHRATAAGENEIAAARALLGCLDFGGTLMTADAIHGERNGQTSRARRSYLSSACPSPERFATAVRAHWSTENSQHRVLDTASDEDRKDDGPESLAALRRPALDVLREARPAIPIGRKRKRAGWSDGFARSILAQMR